MGVGGEDGWAGGWGVCGHVQWIAKEGRIKTVAEMTATSTYMYIILATSPR